MHRASTTTALSGLPGASPGTTSDVDLPVWLRATLQLSFVGLSLVDRVAMLYSAALQRCVPPHLRDAATAYLYERSAAYQAGRRFGRGGYFDHIFPWEEELVRAFPSGGRLLLGGAGSGRELAWLIAHGFRVVAFEPSALASLAANRVGAAEHDAQVIRASYKDLVDGVLRQRGPLVDALQAGPFDGVIFGWGSLSHVWDIVERSDLFAAIRRHSPRAPIAASFLCRKPERVVADARVLGAWLSRCRHLAAPLFPGSDVTFIGGHGFCHLFTEHEIHRLAADHDYVLDRYRTTPYPHALFAPVTARQQRP